MLYMCHDSETFLAVMLKRLTLEGHFFSNNLASHMPGVSGLLYIFHLGEM